MALLADDQIVQAIFNKVITAKYYPTMRYMCGALHQAAIDNIITTGECCIAVSAIDQYLNTFGFLRSLLEQFDYPAEIEDRLAIYKNWSNRPIFVQQVFDKVITAGHYNPDNTFMCNALYTSLHTGTITEKEYSLAMQEIHNYLHGCLVFKSGLPFSTLYNHLKHCNHPYSFDHLLTIYRNWDNRPFQ